MERDEPKTTSNKVVRSAASTAAKRQSSPARTKSSPARKRSTKTLDDTKTRQDEWTPEVDRLPTLLVRRTLRSGQRVRFDGNVVVLGDVNPGAEVRAAGDIVVMGWLRGLAHAGANGDDSAMVSAFRLNPTQLRIGPYIGRAPDRGEAVLPDVPEMAEVRDGRLIIDRWRASVLTALPYLGVEAIQP
jgi:septum site-determining protein MinC